MSEQTTQEAPTVREIVEEWLKRDGYDGLYSRDACCSCFAGDLMPCLDPCGACRPGYAHKCPASISAEYGAERIITSSPAEPDWEQVEF
ncbi:MAG TPA: hypothetical protein VMY35_11280 [Phycisphaerae bacterium]|nr:hypothetical protein [Phycisphaerae bacterium]